jgi:adenine/guanine phosphoribosyltransferase-like PRPP-binding protein
MDLILKYLTEYLLPSLILFTLGLFTLLDILHTKGIKVPLYSNFLAQGERERVRNYLADIYDTEYEYLHQNEEWRIKLLLKQLTLVSSQRKMVEKELRKLSRSPINTHTDRQETLRRICKNPLVYINTDGMSNLSYREVKYFLNFFDIMSTDRERHKISQIMANHIKEILKEKPTIENYCIVVPPRGNFLLGNEVSAFLKVPVVFMRNNGRVREDQPWDGSFCGIDDFIIIHDVTVTAEQIIETVNNLNGKKVKGLFTLVLRTDKNAEIKLQKHVIDVFPILKFDEESLRKTIEAG